MPGIRGISGSGRLGLVSERGFVQSIRRILFNSRNVSVMTSFGCHDFRIFVSFSAVVQIFLCLYCHLLVEIQDFVSGLCLSGDLFDLWDDFPHRTDTLPRAFQGNGEHSRCYLEAMCFRNLSKEVCSRLAVNPNWQCHSATVFPRNYGRCWLYIEILGNGKSWL